MFSAYEIIIGVLILVVLVAALFENSVVGILVSIILLALFVKVFWKQP